MLKPKLALSHKAPHKCWKCGGPSPYDEDEGIYKCVNCGYEEVNKLQRHEFLESHKQEILKDVLAIGPEKTKAKWRLPSLTWGTLKERWGLRKVWWAASLP